MRCKYPGCGHEGPHRPYSKERIPSASTIAGLLNDDKARAFGWAAALITATEAVHTTEWQRLTGLSERAVKNGYDTCQQHKDGLCAQCDYLRREHDKRWRAKADLGTHVHHMALSWSMGDKVEVDTVTEDYMDALAGFYAEHKPKFVELERTVLFVKPEAMSYRGQFDTICDINCPVEKHGRCRWLIDYKTGGFHPVDQTLQLAAYRHAEYITEWQDGKEVRVKPMPAVAHAGVLMLRGDGEFRLVELPADQRTHRTFLQLRLAWSFARQISEQFKEAA